MKTKDSSLLDMDIFVPSRSRWQRSLTLEALDGKWEPGRVALVVPTAQRAQYVQLAKRHSVKLHTCNATTIAMTRHHCGVLAKDKFVMMDDDLRFYLRPSQEDWHLHKLGKHDVSAMLLFVSRLLDQYKHVAVSAREGNNRLDYPMIENSRPLRVLAYRKKEFLACVHGRVSFIEDFDVELQLLRKGYPNCVITAFAQDQPATQSPGGCSDYRTQVSHAANIRRLAQLHPGLVNPRQKQNRTGGEFGVRLEATIYWKKAYEQALKEFL